MVVTGVAGHNTQVNLGGYLLVGVDKAEQERHKIGVDGRKGIDVDMDMGGNRWEEDSVVVVGATGWYWGWSGYRVQDVY